MAQAVRYIGPDPCPVTREGDRPIKHGETITGPEDLLEYLSARADFEVVGEQQARKSAKKDAAEPAKE